MPLINFNYLFTNGFIKNQPEIKKLDFGYFILISINIGVLILFSVINSFVETGVIDSGRFNPSDFKDGFVIFLIMAVIIFPFFEELIHRSYVSKRKNTFWSLIFVLVYFFLISDFSFIRITLFSLYGLFILSIIFSKKLYQNKIYLLLFTSLFFALFHVFKYESIQSIPLPSLLISLFPQFITGVILFFVHSRYGFIVGVVHHGLINGILLVFIYTSILLFEPEMSASLIAD